jgi:hypothetical protein
LVEALIKYEGKAKGNFKVDFGEFALQLLNAA